MKTAEDLRQLLTRIDRERIPGIYDTKEYTVSRALCSESTCTGRPVCGTVQASRRGGKTAGFPERLYDKSIKDWCCRMN